MVETKVSFEEQLQDLEAIVARLEEGNLPLEETVSLFERGVVLMRGCRTILADAESRVEAVLAPEDGGPVRTQAIAVDVDEMEEDDDEE